MAEPYVCIRCVETKKFAVLLESKKERKKERKKANDECVNSDMINCLGMFCISTEIRI